MRVLIVGPFLGELGWELFSWQPYVRGLFIQNGFDKCVVYGKSGRDSLYNFAEYHPINVVEEESECNFIHNFEQHRTELEKLSNGIIEENKKVYEGFQFFWFNNLSKLNDVMYMAGRPNLIESIKGQENRIQLVTDGRKQICLCVRNRQLSDFRNWDFDNWYSLMEKLQDEYNVCVIGEINEEGWKVPEGVIDLTNQTTINDCVDIFSQMDLVVGGSTGLMHLASRMGKSHLVWGVPKNKLRYGETNWFGADYKVFTDKAWMPDVEDIHPLITSYFKKGTF